MNRAALNALHDVDVVIFVVDARHWNEQDDWVLKHLKKLNVPIILAVNKIDKLSDRTQLLPYLENGCRAYYSFLKLFLSALRMVINGGIGKMCGQLFACSNRICFLPDQLTDRSDRFIAAETVREKLMRLLGQELPYALTVTIDAFEDEPNIAKIAAVIWVEKSSQKPIVIGESGERLKMVGQKARWI